MRIIPAIDIIEGQCVRLEKGDYSRQTTYHTNPLEVAKSFEDHGLTYLHLVDLDGAKAGTLKNWKVIEQICTQTDLIVDVGGGIKHHEDVQKALNAGAHQINVGSLAVKSPDTVYQWIETFGAEVIILSADVREGYIAIHGWQTLTDIGIKDFIHQYALKGIQYITCTDIAKDGMMAGPSYELYQSLLTSFPDLHFIASGGISSLLDLDKLAGAGMDGAIIGKAIYEGLLPLEQLKNWSEQIRK